MGHPSRTPRRLRDSVTAAWARQRQDRAPARRLHRRPHHPGVCLHHRQRPRCDRRRRDIDGTCHIVGSDRLTRQQLYVAAPAAKTKTTSTFPPPKPTLTASWRPATHPPTAVDILSQILRRDGAQVSAHSAAAAESDPFTRLRRGRDVLRRAHRSRRTHRRRGHHGPHRRRRRRDPRQHHRLRRLAGAAAQPGLAVDGHDPIEALHAAAATPPGNPIDVAAVLDWRLQTPQGSAAERVGPLRWLAATPDALAAHPNGAPTCTRAPSSSAIWPTRSAPPRANGSPVPSRPGRALAG